MNSVSIQAQAEQEESSSTIKFTHAKDGNIDFNSGYTVFSDLLMLGAFASTKSLKSNHEALWHEYATDFEGLESLATKSSEIMETVADTIGSLSMVLAYVDREVGNKHINNMHWLLAGLGELAAQICIENKEITHSLHQLSKQAGLGKEV